jgi:hypothetical protein
MNTHDKFYWVSNHPQFGDLGASIHIEPQMVNPETKEIDDDVSKNTELNWWVEIVYYDHEEKGVNNTPMVPWHDWALDTGGVTIDEAIDKLYDLTLALYGDYAV